MIDLTDDEYSWSYRIMIGLDDILSIREVHYDAAGDITWWSMFPVEPKGDEVEYLWDDINDMRDAFDMPILMEKDLNNQITVKDNNE